MDHLCGFHQEFGQLLFAMGYRGCKKEGHWEAELVKTDPLRASGLERAHPAQSADLGGILCPGHLHVPLPPWIQPV